uniref:Transketolase n=1 Tax=Ascaris lumbricoides TaxID=6252 RepID=A0A0M3INI7_ASCLU
MWWHEAKKLQISEQFSTMAGNNPHTGTGPMNLIAVGATHSDWKMRMNGQIDKVFVVNGFYYAEKALELTENHVGKHMRKFASGH